MLRGEWLDPDLRRITVDEYVTRWVSEHRLSPRPRDLYEGLNRLHIRPVLGGVPLGGMSTEKARNWRAELLRTGRSEGVVVKAYRLPRVAVNTAVDDGRIGSNPCRLKGADSAHSPERPITSVRQVFALARAVGPQHPGLRAECGVDESAVGRADRTQAQGPRLGQGAGVRAPESDRGWWKAGGVPAEEQQRADGHTAGRSHGRVGCPPRGTRAPGWGGPGLRRREGGDSPSRELAGQCRHGWRRSENWAAAGVPLPRLKARGEPLGRPGRASTRELIQRMGHSTVLAALIHQHDTKD